MTKWQTLKAQILASTHTDSQGETHSEQSLRTLCTQLASRNRLPLNQQHDLTLDPVGYLEDFQIVPAADRDGWHLLADVTFHDVEIDDALRGFSYSLTEKLVGASQPAISVFLPYPQYNDNALLTEIAEIHENVAAGAWRKKSAESDRAMLVLTLALFAVGPWYNNFWNTQIIPVLRHVWQRFGAAQRLDFVQVLRGPTGDYPAYFDFPSGGDALAYLTLARVTEGLERLQAHVTADPLASTRSIHLSRLAWSESAARFEVASVQYRDGSVVNYAVAP